MSSDAAMTTPDADARSGAPNWSEGVRRNDNPQADVTVVTSPL
jgi:hypothetical protein